MKILHVATHEGAYRGGAVQICRIAAAQRRRGHQVSVIAHERPERPEGKKRKERESWAPLIEAGVSVDCLPYSKLRGKLALRRVFKSGGFDVVHAHRDQALVACWLASWRMKRPALIAQRGTIHPPPRWPARAFRSPRTRAVVAVAEAVKVALGNHVDSVREKTEVIYGSVDLEAFAPRAPAAELKASLGFPPGARIVGSLSAFRTAKGFRYLLEALARVFEADPDVHAVFIGMKVPKRVEPIARELRLGDRCRFFGHQTNIAEWLSIMDLTVMAATDREGLSGVLRESLAMEIPVVSTDCAGNGEIVHDRETGLLVPMRDVDALAEAIGWALAHPEEMKGMARAGRRWVQAHSSIDAQAEQLDRVYRSVLNRG